MKRRILFVLLCLTVAGLISFSTGTLGNTERAKSTPSAFINPSVAPQEQISPDPPGTIDGSKTPELIPDHIAYSILFRLISDRQTDAEKSRIRSYIRQVILKCPSCGKRTEKGQQVISNDADTEALIVLSEKFHQRAKVLDSQAAEIRGRSWPDPDPAVAAQLRDLERQTEGLATETAFSLPSHLSPAGVEKVRRHINEYVKRKVKIVPGPQPNTMQHSQHRLG